MKRMISFTCLLALGACGGLSTMTDPVSPANVAALEEAVTIAETLALNYTRLPLCPTAAPACSVAATRQTIKVYAQKAYEAVKTLRASSSANAPAALAAARAALAALEASIPVPPAAGVTAGSAASVPITN